MKLTKAQLEARNKTLAETINELKERMVTQQNNHKGEMERLMSKVTDWEIEVEGTKNIVTRKDLEIVKLQERMLAAIDVLDR